MPSFDEPINPADYPVSSPLIALAPRGVRILSWLLIICLINFAVILILISFIITCTEVISIWEHFHSVKYFTNKETIPDLLEVFDYILVAVIILVIGFSLVSVTYNIMPNNYKFTDYSPPTSVYSLLLNDFIEAMERIDRLILSMATILLVMTFIIYTLREKNDNIGINILFLGFGVGAIILVITIYLYFTRRE